MSVYREMTLKEWCARLPSIHLVNKELSDLEAQLAEADHKRQMADDKCIELGAAVTELRNRLAEAQGDLEMINKEYRDCPESKLTHDALVVKCRAHVARIKELEGALEDNYAQALSALTSLAHGELEGWELAVIMTTIGKALKGVE